MSYFKRDISPSLIPVEISSKCVSDSAAQYPGIIAPALNETCLCTSKFVIGAFFKWTQIDAA